jgi:hypothetical protein
MKSNAGWIVGVLAFLAILFVVMIRFGGLQWIDRQFAVKEDEHFLVEGAVTAEPRLHRWLMDAASDKQGMDRRDGLFHRAHRIIPGDGTVIGWRYAYDEFNVSDDEYIIKLMLFLPGPLPEGDSLITLGRGEGQPYAVQTRGSWAWNLNCVGFAREGTVRIERKPSDRLIVDFDFAFEQIDAEGTARSNWACAPQEYRKRKILEIIDYDDLTAWQGRAEGPVSREERWP